MNVDQRIALIDELSGDQCRCGNRKRHNQTFCWGCYKQLPREMQADLYRRFGLGYEEAYAAAVKYFEERGTQS